jgi:hypothetical protein
MKVERGIEGTMYKPCSIHTHDNHKSFYTHNSILNSRLSVVEGAYNFPSEASAVVPFSVHTHQ